MKRTQIMLTEEQFRMVKRRAFEEGISMAEFIRRAINEYLEKRKLKKNS